jgi:mannose-6-phosphate isomerase
MIYPLKNPIKNFPWGSRTVISDHFGIENLASDHQAELWMGAHPSSSSVISSEGIDVRLCDAISSNPELWLGKNQKISQSLPFLMKVLAAEEPLSIQVHPSKTSAESGFASENERGVPLDSECRNYKDPNHKPELVYAITPYLAMNGFREFEQIVANFDLVDVSSIEDLYKPFRQNPCSLTLASFFSSLLALNGDRKERAIVELLASIEESKPDFWPLIKRLQGLYPRDIGLFSPLFLNIIELKPGQAMFLYAETPHAYINGLGVEIMANSDNVLRAGLTPKHIDIDELVKNTCFEPISFKSIVMEPVKTTSIKSYPIPVDDFKFDVITPVQQVLIPMKSAEILFCLSGSINIKAESGSHVLNKGESVVLPASANQYEILGQGTVARAYY